MKKKLCKLSTFLLLGLFTTCLLEARAGRDAVSTLSTSELSSLNEYSTYISTLDRGNILKWWLAAKKELIHQGYDNTNFLKALSKLVTERISDLERR